MEMALDFLYLGVACENQAALEKILHVSQMATFYRSAFFLQRRLNMPAIPQPEYTYVCAHACLCVFACVCAYKQIQKAI